MVLIAQIVEYALISSRLGRVGPRKKQQLEEHAKPLKRNGA
jgi:hypothetical protein